MNREEAIDNLQDLWNEVYNEDSDGYTYAVAIDMAIEALQDTPTESTNTSTNTPTDLISREDAIEAIQNAYCKPCKERGDDHNEVRCRACEYDNAIIQIDALPSADRPSGEWIVDGKHTDEVYTHPVICSVCGQDVVIEWGEFTPFCPNCGADMRKNNEQR